MGAQSGRVVWAFGCPFCERDAALVEVPGRGRAAVHKLPMCAGYERLSPEAFVEAARLKYRHAAGCACLSGHGPCDCGANADG